MSSGSNWFDDPDVLVSELQKGRARGRPAPEIPGYDDLREIGRGGQGAVYAAVQRSTRRTVAVKVFSEAAVSGPARRRFEREIDLVASLRHPGIVSVYDSGVTSDGRPYLVMEHVQGQPIDDHAATLGAGAGPVGELVWLFASVCDAINYAHQRGVIHRDLKPSNIRIDPEKQPHILDFGLAKAAGATATQTTVPTVSTTGQFLGSIPWASPEQADGDPSRVDIRSDVYSLGVVLYQLLTGRFPYDVSSGLREALDNIVHAEPGKPSVSRAGVNDELDTVVLKCLAKDPDRRYQTAGDLARDLRHYLAGEPIQAKRDSAWYTVRKTIRRYQVAAAIAASFVVLVSVGLIATLWSYRSAVRQAARAEAARQFLADTIGAVDPDKDGREVRVVDLLDRSARQIDTRFAGQDDLRAMMHETLCTLYEHLGQMEPAAREANAALAIRSAGGDQRALLAAKERVWSFVHGQGKSAEAEPELKKVLEEQERVLGPEDPDTISTLADLGQVEVALGRPADAEGMYRRAIATWLESVGPDDSRVLTVNERLAAALDHQGKSDEAIALYRDVLARRKRVNGPDHSETISVAGNLAVSLIDRGRLAEAETLQREILEACKRKYGDEAPQMLSVMNNLAKTIQDLGHLEEAEQMMRATLDARIRVLGEEHPHTLVTMNNLGVLLSLRGHKEESVEFARKVLAIRERTLGPDKLDTIISTNNLAGGLCDIGKAAEAEPLYQRAIAAAGRALPPEHWINAVFKMNHGQCLVLMERYPEAEQLLRPAYERLNTALGPDHAHTKKARSRLANLYEKWGKPEEAAAFRDVAQPDAAKK